MPDLNQIWIRISLSYLIQIHHYHSPNPKIHPNPHQQPKPITISYPTNIHIPTIITFSFNHLHQPLHRYKIYMILIHIYPNHQYHSSNTINPPTHHYIPSSNTFKTKIVGIWMTCPNMNIVTYYRAGITWNTTAFLCTDMAVRMLSWHHPLSNVVSCTGLMVKSTTAVQNCYLE